MVEVQNSPEDGSEKYHDYAIEKKVLGALPEKHARAFRKLDFDEQRRIRNGVKNAYGRDVSAVRTTLIVSTASGALVVGGVRDICSSSIEYRWIDPGDRFECSMEYNQSVSGSQWQSVVVCGSLW